MVVHRVYYKGYLASTRLVDADIGPYAAHMECAYLAYQHNNGVEMKYVSPDGTVVVDEHDDCITLSPSFDPAAERARLPW